MSYEMISLELNEPCHSTQLVNREFQSDLIWLLHMPQKIQFCTCRHLFQLERNLKHPSLVPTNCG